MLTICRLCFRKDANFVIANGQTAMRIMSCAGLEVDKNDGLPQLICQACRLRLEEFHYFRKRCHAADRRLRYLRRNGEYQAADLWDGSDDDLILLKDVAKCAATVCSESNAHWRRKAAQLIRTEIDAYKKELLSLCKHQLREEIAQQVSTEIRERILTEAKKECRLKVLDELFYEIETIFVQKRNDVVCEQVVGSEGFVSDLDASELETVSTVLNRQPPDSEREPTVLVEYTNMEAEEVSVIDLNDDEPNQQTMVTQASSTGNIPASKNSTVSATPIAPMTMVEINMDNSQLSHLREELHSASHFLTSTSPTTTTHKLSPCSKKFNAKKFYQQISLCRKHNMESKNPQRSDSRNCYRCRLRGSHSLNKSVI